MNLSFLSFLFFIIRSYFCVSAIAVSTGMWHTNYCPTLWLSFCLLLCYKTKSMAWLCAIALSIPSLCILNFLSGKIWARITNPTKPNKLSKNTSVEQNTLNITFGHFKIYFKLSLNSSAWSVKYISNIPCKMIATICCAMAIILINI